MDDKILRVASEVYSAPKVYALLLGSGISHAARIPTGQQLMDKLIRRIAHPKGENIERHPSEWYERHFGKKPTYGSVIERLGREQADRSNLIRPYFERQPEDQDDDKLPTRAHHAIARLIKEGYIQVILTTNFDPLLEQALQTEGIRPHIISTPQAAIASAPLQHQPVTIVKLHGDYLDIGILNTADELNEYDSAINKLLDKVLSEWGLIICGWSAESDMALQTAFARAPQSPYSTHWITYQGEVTQEAKAIIDARKAEQIDTMGADTFFDELEQNVMALKSLDAIHELSPKVAAERVRRLLSTNDLISLETWLNTELEQAHELFISQPFRWELHDLCPDWRNLEKCVDVTSTRYFSALETHLHMIATLCWHGKGNLNSVLAHTLSHWLEIPTSERGFASAHLPILFVIYTVGIAAIEQENWQYLQAIFFDPYIPKKNQGHSSNFLVYLYEETFRRYFSHDTALSLGKPLYSLLRSVFQSPLIASNERYQRAFDLFELILNLAYLVSPERDPQDKWIPYHENLLENRSWNYLTDYLGSVSGLRNGWGLLQIQPFKGHDFAGLIKLYYEALEGKQRNHPQLRFPISFAEAYKPPNMEVLSG